MGNVLFCVFASRAERCGVEWRHAGAPPPWNRASLPDVDRLLVRVRSADGPAVQTTQSTKSLDLVGRPAGRGGASRFCVSVLDAAYFLSGWEIH
jgi:hypothetical protein